MVLEVTLNRQHFLFFNDNIFFFSFSLMKMSYSEVFTMEVNGHNVLLTISKGLPQDASFKKHASFKKQAGR